MRHRPHAHPLDAGRRNFVGQAASLPIFVGYAASVPVFGF